VETYRLLALLLVVPALVLAVAAMPTVADADAEDWPELTALTVTEAPGGTVAGAV
jgi:hypothetical protein